MKQSFEMKGLENFEIRYLIQNQPLLDVFKRLFTFLVSPQFSPQKCSTYLSAVNQFAFLNHQKFLIFAEQWYSMVLVFPAGLSRPGKSRDVPGRDHPGTGLNNFFVPGTFQSRDLARLKVPGLFLRVPGRPGTDMISPLIQFFQHI